MPHECPFYSPTPMRAGGFVFRSDFDSGNLRRVEPDFDQGDVNAFRLWLNRDCADTPFETTHSAWFHFSVAREDSTIDSVRMTIMNMSKLQKLFGRGNMQPWIRRARDHPLRGWRLLPDRVACATGDDGMELSMRYCFEAEEQGEPVYFAFCVPYPWSLCRAAMDELDARFGTNTPGASTEHSNEEYKDFHGAHEDFCGQGRRGGRVLLPLSGHDDMRRNKIYYRRETLVRSLGGRPLDVLTITSLEDMECCEPDALRECGQNECERQAVAASAAARSKLYSTPGLFPDSSPVQFPTFRDRPVVLLSARVHPGETPASFLLEGALRFLLDASSPRAQALRRRFVFKIVPVLNPDGVALGHYRQDTRGRNLNRCYASADCAISSSDGGRGKRSDVASSKVERGNAWAGAQATLSSAHNGGGRVLDGEEGSGSDGDGEDEGHEEAGAAPTPEVFALRALARAASEGAFSYRTDNAAATARERAKLARQSAAGGMLHAFIDLHAHASKKGMFIFGNHHFGVDERVQCRLLPYLLEKRCSLFEYCASDFSINNMVKKDNRGEGKAGCSRVMIAQDTGCPRVYTLESNYNTTSRSRLEGNIAPAAGRQFTVDDWVEVGENMMSAMLDASGGIGDMDQAAVVQATSALRRTICGGLRNKRGGRSGVAATAMPATSGATGVSAPVSSDAATIERGLFQYEVTGRMVIVRSGPSLQSARRTFDSSGAEVGSVYRRGEVIEGCERWHGVQGADGVVRVRLSQTFGGGFVSESSGKGVELMRRISGGVDAKAPSVAQLPGVPPVAACAPRAPRAPHAAANKFGAQRVGVNLGGVMAGLKQHARRRQVPHEGSCCALREVKFEQPAS